MSVLEEKIKKNREQYDAHEPAEGHFDRFASRLDAQLHASERKGIGRMSLIRYAAAILLIGSIAGVLFIQFVNDSSSVNANPLNDELAMVRDHYNQLTDQKLNEISTCAASDEEAAKVGEIARTQIEKLEKDASLLQKELDKDASNDRVYGALVNNYRTRIKILDNIITRVCQL
jgi:hypothetical protein